MVTTVSTPTGQYAYLLLSFKGSEPERELWEALFERDKAALSIAVYNTVMREMAALKESTRIKQARSTEKNHVRRLFLLVLPEYGDVIRFIQGNIRRPAFKDHLKRLILYGVGNPEPSTSFPASNPEPETTTASEAANHATRKDAKRSPRELFSEPGKLLQLMVMDVKRPEAERLFIWDEIPPEDYPEAMRNAPPFSRLVQFWKATKNIE